MTSLRKTSSSSGSSYSSGSSGSASMRSADGPPYAFLLESGPSPSPGLFTPLMVVFALRSRGLSDVFFKRYALGHASTRERGLHRSVRKRSRGFLHDASLKLGLSRATRGLVPHRRVPEWVSQRPMEESFHEKVSVPIPAKCDNLVLGDSKRWRTLERITGTRQRHTKSRRAPAPKEKEVSHRKSCPVPDHRSSARQSLFAQ